MKAIPKTLLMVKGKPVLSHVIDFWKDKVDNFVFIIRREATYLWEFLPSNGAVVFQDEPQGLADAILRAEPYIKDECVIALGDCFQLGQFALDPCRDLAVGVWETNNDYEILKNYIVGVEDKTITAFTEKPKEITSRLCGMGTYFMDKRVFFYIRKALPSLKPGGGDFTEVLQMMVDCGEVIYPNFFEGTYINVNSPQDLAAADEMLDGEK